MDQHNDSKILNGNPDSPSGAGSEKRTLRLWPGIAAVVTQWVLRFVPPLLSEEAFPYALLGTFIFGFIIIIWWAFFSRAPWQERVGAIVLMALGLLLTPSICDKSITTAMMGFMYPIYTFPILCLALVTWAFASRNMVARSRWVSMVVSLGLACSVMAVFRSDGMDAAGGMTLAWRWSQTPESRFLAEVQDTFLATPGELPGEGSAPSWPGFRGANRDGVVHGLKIKTDWAAFPPKELWRRNIGPGWSSFSVQGDRFYTQEQRGDDELVSCYSLSTGQPIWQHRDPARFWEAIGGAGPRATPTLSDGHIYSMGATGILNALKASDGSVVWSRNPAEELKLKTPGWGFSGSPLVVDDMVIVALAGSMVAYDRANGQQRWTGPIGSGGYASPQSFTLHNVPQILLNGSKSLVSMSLDGKLLWENATTGSGILQPALTDAGEIVLGADGNTRLLAVAHDADRWAVSERWTTNQLKPYFSDYVIHKGHVFGFDGRMLACLNLADGQRTWKGGRYGQGQLVLLADQDLLIVLSEKGALALVEANLNKYMELSQLPALDGKTWNHLSLSDNLLLVRNGSEMAAFRLPLESE